MKFDRYYDDQKAKDLLKFIFRDQEADINKIKEIQKLGKILSLRQFKQ